MAREAATWAEHRNQEAHTIDWRFTTDDARIKLKRLYRRLRHDVVLGRPCMCRLAARPL